MKVPDVPSANLSLDAVGICLLGAVIKQAIVDYFNPQLCGSGYYAPKYKKATEFRKKLIQEEARKFLFTEDLDHYLQHFGLTINLVYLRKLVTKCQDQKYRTNLLAPDSNVLMKNLWL